MVVGVSKIRLQRCCAELWVGSNEVLWETVQAQHGPLNAGRDRRQSGVAARGVVQRVKRVGEGRVIAIRQIVAQITRCGGAKLSGSRLKDAIDHCSDSPRSSSA